MQKVNQEGKVLMKKYSTKMNYITAVDMFVQCSVELRRIYNLQKFEHSPDWFF